MCAEALTMVCDDHDDLSFEELLSAKRRDELSDCSICRLDCPIVRTSRVTLGIIEMHPEKIRGVPARRDPLDCEGHNLIACSFRVGLRRIETSVIYVKSAIESRRPAIPRVEPN